MFVYYILFYCFRVISKGLAIRKIRRRKNLLTEFNSNDSLRTASTHRETFCTISPSVLVRTV